jgi:hypothetical protein
MFELTLSLSDDKKTALVALPNMAAPQNLSADELSDLIRHLAWLRAGMEPRHEPVDLTPDTLVSNVPAIRWQVTEDDIQSQCRLYLLHPGFGWSHIPLDQPSFDDLSAKARMFLRAKRVAQ